MKYYYLNIIILFTILINSIYSQTQQTITYYYGVDNTISILSLYPLTKNGVALVNGEYIGTRYNYINGRYYFEIDITAKQATSSSITIEIEYPNGWAKINLTIYPTGNIVAGYPLNVRDNIIITGIGLTSVGKMTAIYNDQVSVDLKCTDMSNTLWNCVFPSGSAKPNSCFTIRYTAPYLSVNNIYYENTFYVQPFLNSVKTLGDSLLMDINFRCPNISISGLGISLDTREFDNSVVKANSPNGNLYYFEPSSFTLCSNPSSTVNVTFYTGIANYSNIKMYSNSIKLNCDNDNSDVANLDDISNCSIINLNYYFIILLSTFMTTIIIFY